MQLSDTQRNKAEKKLAKKTARFREAINHPLHTWVFVKAFTNRKGKVHAKYSRLPVDTTTKQLNKAGIPRYITVHA